MDIVVDASALLAVIVGEPERNRLIELTAVHSLVGLGSLPWEIGSAFSAILKQQRLTLEAPRRGLGIFRRSGSVVLWSIWISRCVSLDQ